MGIFPEINHPATPDFRKPPYVVFSRIQTSIQKKITYLISSYLYIDSRENIRHQLTQPNWYRTIFLAVLQRLVFNSSEFSGDFLVMKLASRCLSSKRSLSMSSIGAHQTRPGRISNAYGSYQPDSQHIPRGTWQLQPTNWKTVSQQQKHQIFIDVPCFQLSCSDPLPVKTVKKPQHLMHTSRSVSGGAFAA